MFEFLFKKKKRKISLVLGGGGARGFFHIGVINAIRDLDIEVVEISGTSIGAIVGTIFAADPEIDFMKILDDVNLLKFLGLLFNANDEKAIKKLQDIFTKYIDVSDFNELKIPMSFNATDIKTGEEVVFRTGKIFPGLVASMAIPFVFPVVKMGNKNLSDGGITNSLPISLIQNNRKDMVASILNSSLPEIKNLKDGISLFSNVFAIMENNILNRSIEDVKKEKGAHLELIKLGKLSSTFDFRRKNAEYLMNLGYREAMKILK